MKKVDSNRAFSPLAIAVVCAATLGSGAAGLIYEVVWSRMLVVPLGNSSDAVALVLCSFMLGMALGARFIGAIADRLRSPLKVYVIAELFLGVYALAMPFVIPKLAGTDLDWMLRLVFGVVLVLIPAAAMGASMPVLTRALSRVGSDVGKRVGLFYGFNTVGGAAGAAIAGFIAAPSLGLMASSFVAAGISIAAALIVLGVSRLGATRTPKNVEPATEKEVSLPSRKVAIAALLAAGIGGFAMLAAEVLWARVLTFVFGHDTYAFSILLVVVLAGLGLGGLIYRMIAHWDPARVAAVMLAMLGLATLVSYWAAAQLVIELGRDPFSIGASSGLSTSLWVEFYRELAFTPILVLLPSIAAGVSLPAACALYSGPVAGSGRRVGTVILVNGVAAALGSIIAAFVAVPTLGINVTFIVIFAIAWLGAAFVAGLSKKFAHLGKKKFIAAVAAVAALVVVSDSLPSDLPQKMLQEAVGERHQEILHYEEGRTGTVSVTKNKINGERQLFMNAVNEVTTRLVHDQSFKLLGHLGPLIHPKPEKGLMICFGAGISAGAAAVHPLETLDVVELSSTIPGAAGHFTDVNNNIIEDPRLNLHIEDGRHFLLRSKEKYDLVMVDSTHPKAVDSWILYTSQFYRLAYDHLDEEGIAVQWVPLHGLSEKEFKIIVATFQSVFEQTTLWVNVGSETYGQVAYVKLVGTKAPLAIDYRELAMRLKEPRIKKDLAPYGMDEPMEILDTFLAGPASVRSWTEGLPIQTDDRPFLPYITEYSQGRRMEAALLLAVRSAITPHLYRMGEKEPEIIQQVESAHEAQGFLLAGMLDRAADAWPKSKKIPLFQERAASGKAYYTALAKLYDDDPDKLFETGSYLGNLGFPKEALELYEKSLKLDPESARTRINRALVLMDLRREEEATRALEGIVKDEPDNALALYNLGVALLDGGDAGTAVEPLKRAVDLDPDLVGASLSLAEAYRQLGRMKKAQAVLRKLTERARWVPEGWDMMGLIEASKGNWDLAKRHHSKALMLDPYSARAHYNMAIALQEEGRLQAAAEAYKAALRVEPDDAEAHNNLGLVYGAAGMFDKAADHHRKALDIEPHYPEAAFNLGLAYRGMGRVLLAAEAFALAQTLAPDLEAAGEQLKELGLDRVRIQVTDAGPEDFPDAGVDAGRKATVPRKGDEQ